MIFLIFALMTEKNDIDVRLLFSLLNGRAARAISDSLGARFRRAGLPLRAKEWPVLLYISAHKGCTQAEVAAATYLDYVSMTRICQRLEREDILWRERDITDRRAVILKLTRRGQHVRDEAARLGQRLLVEALMGLSYAEIQTCQQVLRHVLGRLSGGGRGKRLSVTQTI